MNELETNQVQSLEKWLEVATAKLCIQAKERIRTEIEAHFGESTDGHRAKGCSEFEADAAALAELGDPIAAAKRFRKRHLTENEAKRLEQALRYAGRPVWLLVSYPLYAVFYAYFLHVLKSYHAPLVVPTIAILMCPVLQTVEFFMAHRKDSERDLRLLFLTQIVGHGCMMLFFVWLGIWGDWSLCVAMSLGLTISSVIDLRIWLKLGQIDGAWLKNP